jgi:flagellar motor switch protein FliN/FliY
MVEEKDKGKPNQIDLDSLLKEIGVTPQGKSKEVVQKDVKPGEDIPGAHKVEFETFEAKDVKKPEKTIELLKDITLSAVAELGRCKMRVGDVLKLGPGSVVEMDKLTGDPLDLYVNDRLVARGEILIINENFAFRVTEVIIPGKEKE